VKIVVAIIYDLPPPSNRSEIRNCIQNVDALRIAALLCKIKVEFKNILSVIRGWKIWLDPPDTALSALSGSGGVHSNFIYYGSYKYSYFS